MSRRFFVIVAMLFATAGFTNPTATVSTATRGVPSLLSDGIGVGTAVLPPRAELNTGVHPQRAEVLVTTLSAGAVPSLRRAIAAAPPAGRLSRQLHRGSAAHLRGPPRV